MRSLRSESLLIFPLFLVFVLGAYPFMLMGFLGFAGIGLLGLLMMSAALTVGLDADAEFAAQRENRSSAFADRTLQSSTRDAMVRFAKATGAAGAVLVAIAAAGVLTA